MDHYQALQDRVKRLRQEEWHWQDDLLSKIDPMAPDAALKFDYKGRTTESASREWKPQLQPLRPSRPVDQPANEESKEQSLPEAQPEPLEPDPAPKAPETEAGNQEAQRLSSHPEEPPAIKTGKASSPKLKGSGPTPIPLFEPTPALAQSNPRIEIPRTEEPEAVLTPETGQSTEESPSARQPNAKRIWPLKLLAPIAAGLIIWAWGIYTEIKPPAKAGKIISTSSTLLNAEKIIIEPGYLFFQLQVDPAHQQRWARNLGLSAIPRNESYGLPRLRAIENWLSTEGYVRPPFSESEVREWWGLQMNEVSYGFYREWPDGSLLILDLENDILIGGGLAEHFTALLN